MIFWEINAYISHEKYHFLVIQYNKQKCPYATIYKFAHKIYSFLKQ